MEYYLAITRNEVPIYATTWMNLENIMLTKKKKPVLKGHRFHLYEITEISKSIETKSRFPSLLS